MPSTAGSALSVSTSASRSSCERVGGQLVLEALHPRGDGRLVLGADIDRGGRILADQHHRQPGRAARRFAKMRDLRRDPLAQPQRECLCRR